MAPSRPARRGHRSIINFPEEPRIALQMDRSPEDCTRGESPTSKFDLRREPGGGNAAASATAGPAPRDAVVRRAGRRKLVRAHPFLFSSHREPQSNPRTTITAVTVPSFPFVLLASPEWNPVIRRTTRRPLSPARRIRTVPANIDVDLFPSGLESLISCRERAPQSSDSRCTAPVPVERQGSFVVRDLFVQSHVSVPNAMPLSVTA
jgi:hypothetical protein